MTAKRVDANQAAIVAALRECGAVVHDTHELGKGFPDILVGWRGAWHPMEVKMPDGRITKDEIAWGQEAVNAGLPYHVVHSPEEAIRVLEGK